MSQMCPNCSTDNLDDAQTCSKCEAHLRGLLGHGTLLSERYSVENVLGYGAMGAVYLANDSRLEGRRCAIKENRPNQALTESIRSQSREQFLAEASTLARLDHARLPKVSDYFVEDNREYLVMDYVEGEDLVNVLFEALQVVFDVGVLENVVAGEGRQRLHSEELEILVQPEKHGVDVLAFEELLRVLEGLQRGVPGR